MSVEMEVLAELEETLEGAVSPEAMADADYEYVTASSEIEAEELERQLLSLLQGDKRPHAQPPCRSPKKTKRGAEHVRRPRAGRTAGIRVVIVPAPELGPEEELLLLRAMELLKRDQDSLKLAYVSRHPLVHLILKTRPWFLAEVHWHGFDDAAKIAGDDVLMEMGVPSHEEALVAEEALYRERHEKTVAALQRQQRDAEESGVKDLKIEIPPYRFQAHWHKGNGLLWKLQDDLGLPLNVPDDPLVPYNLIPRALELETNKKLAALCITPRPFAVYDFRDEELLTPCLEALGQALPGLRLVSIAEIEKGAGEGFLSLLAAMRHPNCEWFVGGRLSGLYAAWAGGVPAVVQILRGEDPVWEGAHAEESYLLQRDRIPDEDVPAGIASGISYLRYSAES